MPTAPFNFGSISTPFSNLGMGAGNTSASTPATPNLAAVSPATTPTFNPSAGSTAMAPSFNMSDTTPAIPKLPAAAPTAGGMSYLVQAGDTIDKIAAAHGVSTQELLAANPNITNPNMIAAGSPLNIPGSTTPTVPTVPGTTPANMSAVNSNPSLSGHPAVPTTDGGTVNSNTGSYTPPSSTTPVAPIVSATTSGTNGSSPTTNNSVYSGATNALLADNQTNPADTGPGVAGYDTALNNLSAFESKLYGQQAAIGSQAIPMPFIQGQQQVAATENAGLLAALTGNVTQAQQGIGYDIQGAQTQNAGLQEAGALTTPVANAPYFGSPETGGMVGEGSAAMQSAVQLQIQKLQNGTTDPATAAAALAGYGQAGLNALQEGLGSSFSIPGAEGAAAATSSNTTLAATATPTAENAIYQKALSDYQDLTQNVANVDQFGTTLTSGMTDSSGNAINPTDSKYANMTIANFRNQLSSPAQAQFDSTYAALKSKISGMLSIGGSETPTTLSNDAASVLDGSAPIGTLQATLSRIQQEGNILLGTQAEKVNNAKSNITPPATSNFGTNGGSGGDAGGSNPFSSSTFFGS